MSESGRSEARAVPGQQPAPQPSRVKGPRVWLDMDQKELDDAYDQSVWAPNQAHVHRRRAVASKATIERLGPPERVAYGPAEIEKLDIYKTDRAGAPALIFLHGGAWRAGSARDFAAPAEMLTAAGAHYVVPDFSWVQDVGGDLMVLADQVRRAVAWVYKNAGNFGGDPHRLYVCGQSSGAHLAGVVLVTEWSKEFGLPPDFIKGGLCASGMYDLKAVRLSARSKYVKFTDEIERELSSQRHLDKLSAPVIVAYGALESPEFQRQAREFGRALQEAGKLAKLIFGEGYNHFELQETLANPYGLLGRTLLEMMHLAFGADRG